MKLATKRKYVQEIQETHGLVRLTEGELKVIIAGTIDIGFNNMGSTRASVIRKLRRATGWDLTGIRLYCRFAYKHGLVRL